MKDWPRISNGRRRGNWLQRLRYWWAIFMDRVEWRIQEWRWSRERKRDRAR